MADLAWFKGAQFFDDNGDPLNGGTLSFFDSGTTSQRTVYKDALAATAWTQPVTLDSAGRLTDAIYVPSGSWKFILKTSAGSTIVSQDVIPGAITIPSAAYAQPETPVIAKAVSYTITTADLGSLIKGDPTGGDIVFTLPSAVTAGNGATLWVQHIGTAGKLTVVPSGVQTIDGGASVSIIRQRGWFRITSDGANWSAEGERAYTTIAKTASFSVTTADHGRTFTVDATSGPVTVSLPAVATVADGFLVTIKRIDATTNAVTIDGNASETIDDALTLVLSTQYEAARLKCNGTAWYGETGASHFGSLTEDAAPDLSADFVVTQDVSAFQRKKVKLLRLFAPVEPQGRLTLTTATPVMSADVTSTGTIYYTPYKGLFFPWYNGTATILASIGAELSLVLDSNAAHTGYHQSGKNFDLFLEDTTGTPRLISGPAWSTDTARATALEYKNGFLCNAASMTAKFDTTSATLTLGQDQGTYVGTFRASADGVTKWVANPAAAAGGGNCQLLLWNAYNRVAVSAASKDSTDTWSYTTATWRAANGNNNNRITAVYGLNEDAAAVSYVAFGNMANTDDTGVGVGLDSTSAYSGVACRIQRPTSTSTAFGSWPSFFNGLAGQGLHFFQALEFGQTGATVWAGDNGAPLNTQMALTYLGRA